MTMEKCECPEGFPQLRQQGFGDHANEMADLWGVPKPWFPKIAHTGQCPSPDQVPEDWVKQFQEAAAV